MIREERLDRQLRIDGWDQGALGNARIGVVGDHDLLASLFVVSASALGLNHLIVVAPRLDRRLTETAHRINPDLHLHHIEGFFTHPAMNDLFTRCSAVVDLSRYGLANKLLVENSFRNGIPLIRGFSFEDDSEQGFKAFSYLRGREWQELEQIVSLHNLPVAHFDDGVLDIITAGIVLEEVKNLLMYQSTSPDLISYGRAKLDHVGTDPVIGVVGAGALGNFVGLGLAYSGFRNMTFLDPDIVEITNLNRQILFYDAVGAYKAAALSERLNTLFATRTRPHISYFRKETDISTFDVIFDCTDNFESRIALSEKCREEGKVLISGGVNVEAGQVVVYDPSRSSRTPAELLGLYDIVNERHIENYRRERASCTYRPDPSVIMTNQIIAGFMVDSCRMLLSGYETGSMFYDSKSTRKI